MSATTSKLDKSTRPKTPHPYFKRQALTHWAAEDNESSDSRYVGIAVRRSYGKNKGRVFLRHLEGEADDHD